MDRTRSKKHVLIHGPQKITARRAFFSPGFGLLAASLLVSGCATGPSTDATPPASAQAPAAAEAVVARDNGARPAVVIRTADGKAVEFIRPYYPDIWSRIRTGFALPRLESPLVTRHEQWFVNNPEFMQHMMERARFYLYYIVEEVEKRGMPAEIALLPAIESAYKPYAYSRARAAGLWQFIPSTGRLYGLKINWWYDGRRDVEAGTKAALDYLGKLHDDFDGDWHLALAAYNAGEGKVSRMIEVNRRRGQPTNYERLKLRSETLNYVPKLQAFVNIVSDPARYGVQLADIPNAPYFTRVETKSQIDLGVAAKLANLDIDELHRINPGHTRWATDPEGPHYLFVPVDKKELLEVALTNLPENERVQWRRHEIARGDTLHQVARRYGVTTEALKTANNLHGNALRVGQDLLIPLSERSFPAAVSAPARATAVAVRGARPLIHRVRSGETLYSISRKYNVLVRRLAEWNQLRLSAVLRLGQRLKVWPGTGTAAVEHESPNG